MDGLIYHLTSSAELNNEISSQINEVIHVFKYHNDGNWKSYYKPKYVQRFSNFIEERPSLIRKLLALKEPVVSNIVHTVVKENKSDV